MSLWISLLSLALAQDPAIDVAVPAAEIAAPSAEAPADVGIEGLVPGPPPDAATANVLARAISEGLRCPVCQGLSVADSSSSAAVMMGRRVHELVSAGYTRDEIEDYFVSKYGEWVLLDPRPGGLNQLVWIGPLLAFGLGLLASLSLLRRTPGTTGTADPLPPPSSDDAFARRILSEADDD